MVKQHRVFNEDEEDESNGRLPLIVLVGNKSDIRNKILVTDEEAESKAHEIGAGLYFECTCMSESSTQELFQRVGTEMFRRREYERVPDERQYSCLVKKQKATV